MCLVRTRGGSGLVTPPVSLIDPRWKLITFTGGTCAGKSTVMGRILKWFAEARGTDVSLGSMTSHTTRPPRSSDTNYEYYTEVEFDRMVENEEFIWVLSYAGYRYGTLKTDLDKVLQGTHPVLLDLEVDPLQKLRSYLGSRLDAVCSFYIHVSPQVQEQRIRVRDAGESEDHFRQRLAESKRCFEMAQRMQNLYIINNEGELDDTLENIIRRLCPAV